jgi:hypothetical protein
MVTSAAAWVMSVDVSALLRTTSREYAFTDWAGGRHLLGSGVLLMNKMMSRAATAIGVGGSDDPRSGSSRTAPTTSHVSGISAADRAARWYSRLADSVIEGAHRYSCMILARRVP